MPRKDIHPTYRTVIFRDVTIGKSYLTRSTRTSKETKEWTDGKTYPVISLDVSSESHIYYTGKRDLNKKKGRVKMFHDRYNRSKK